MSDAALLAQVADDLFREQCPPEVVTLAETTGWAPDLWAAVEAAGLPVTGLPESAGGAGGWLEVGAVARAAARYAAPIPLAETGVLAGWLLAQTGLPLPSGPLTLALAPPNQPLGATRSRDGGWQVDGVVARVPWAATAASVVGLARREASDEWLVFAAPPNAFQREPAANLAGEPRDTLRFVASALTAEQVAPAPIGVTPETLRRRGALVRATQMAGAIDRVATLTIDYAKVRRQFGRPIGAFQAIQQDLARLAGEAVAANAAVDLALEAADRAERCGNELPLAEIAVAKIRTGLAVGPVTRIAHQVHGAIGFTDEHQLRHFTRRLWSWRDEFGGERDWSTQLGRLAVATDLWELVTHTTD